MSGIPDDMLWHILDGEMRETFFGLVIAMKKGAAK
jgi:hypothetical protein